MELSESKLSDNSKQTESLKVNRTNSQLFFHSNQNKQKTANAQAIEEYSKLCMKTYLTPNPSFVSILKTDFLELYVSSYNLKEINCINKIIGKYYYFSEIILAPFNPQSIIYN